MTFSSSDDDSTMFELAPPQAPPIWNHSSEQIAVIMKRIIDQDKATRDVVAGLDPEKCTFESVFVDWCYLMLTPRWQLRPNLWFFYQNVATREELRGAANTAENLLRNHQLEMSMRLDIYQAEVNAAKNIGASSLNPEEMRLIKKLLLEGERDGLQLPEEQRKVVERLQKDLAEKENKFNENFGEEDGNMTFTLEELKGVPEDVISGYNTREEGEGTVYIVSFKDPDIDPLFQYAENPETRRKAYKNYENRLQTNIPLFSQVLDLRFQIAKLLEYPTWVDYVTEANMVKSVTGVRKFLDELQEKLHPVGLNDRETLLKLKKKEHTEKGYPFDGQFYLWDYRYYDRKFTQSSLNLDQNLVKTYFPVSATVGRIIEIYQNLFSIEFLQMEQDTWDSEVKQYAVWKKDAKTQEDFIGYCYLDLFTRTSKYPHVAVWNLVPGYMKQDGTRNYPTVAMVANLANPTPEALMTHDNVVTFFREFGNVVYGLLSRTQFSHFHGVIGVAKDFAQVPSEMLENWVWEPEVLHKISSHYNTQEPLPNDLIEKLIQSRHINKGLKYLKELFYAKYDFEVHSSKGTIDDHAHLWKNLHQEVSLLTPPESPMFGQGTFVQIMSGCDASCYKYIYSYAFAVDMYATVSKQELFSPELGERFKQKILVPGGSCDALDLLREFLGHEPDLEAFMRKVLHGTEPLLAE